MQNEKGIKHICVGILVSDAHVLGCIRKFKRL